MLRLHESRPKDEENFRARLVVAEKERLAKKNRNRLLKKTNRWGQPTHNTVPVQRTAAVALSNDREIVISPEEEKEKGNASTVPTATAEEEAAWMADQNQELAKVRVSRVNDENRHILPRIGADDDDENLIPPPPPPAPKRARVLNDVTNRLPRNAMMIEPAPVDPTLKRKTKKQKTELQKFRERIEKR